MAVLHNRVSQKELKERLYQETEPRITLSFYHYFHIIDPRQFRDDLYAPLYQLKVFGRIYVAHEGINAQVSIPESNYESFVQHLYSIAPLAGIRLNVAVDDDGGIGLLDGNSELSNAVESGVAVDTGGEAGDGRGTLGD